MHVSIKKLNWLLPGYVSIQVPMVSLGNLEWSNLGIESFDEAADVSLASMGYGGNGGGEDL